MNHLDLCSGIGGWALAFRELGIKTIAFCEIEKYPQQVLQKNFPSIPIFNDLKELTYEQVQERSGVRNIDIVTCSYPCQPFSVAGKQKGEEDPRHLWPDTFRIVKECQPTWFVGENVSGHIKLGLDTVLEDLASEDYDTRTFIIPASSVGAWHQRQRLWIIGHKEVSDTDNSRDRTSRHEADREQPQTDQEWQEQSQLELGGHSKNVSDTSSKRSSTQREREPRELEETSQRKEEARSESTVRTSSSCADVSDTESLRLRGRSGEECRTPKWQFLQEEQEGSQIRGEIEGCGASFDESTDTSSIGLEEHGHSEPENVVEHGKETISDTGSKGSQGRISGRQNQERENKLGHAGCSSSTYLQQEENWWQTQSELCGVPHGVSIELDKDRVGRIKGLGNAIVPQIAWFIGNAIISVDISHNISDNN